MILWHQRIYIYNYCITPPIPFPFIHDNTPISILPEMGAFG